MTKKLKKRLTQQQEFEIMKLVLDKFLWVAMVIIGYGVYQGVILENWGNGIAWGVAGIIILILFLVMIVREYEIIR
ncbi:hypothetical protein HOK51_05750 [Candidatus Woesearchaeota archaeon]|jgi:hypothetical protein|nr:hypothetical protein [Candidatus Woesearchaeota archaeon]MBT6519333.1 hypothetical protein [Candidatus Woesearchaeota archaeon]MBT7366793.1 hypothetical protein [Candidatus Woesearchaeota archaeon]